MLTVLNIDDSKIDFSLTRSKLIIVADDIDLIWADSGSTALETLESRHIDCILCDYQMPDVNGIEFLLSLRERKIAIPFIFFTGQGNELVAAEALRNGADDYFTKELEFAQYERIIHSIRKVVRANKEEKRKATLEAETRRFKLISDQANYGNVITSINGRLIYANKMFAQMHGYDLDQLIGMEIKSFHPPESSEVLEKQSETCTDKGSFEAQELWRLRKDGGQFPAIVSATMVNDEEGEAENIVYTVIDISQRKESQRALKESGNNFKWLIEKGPLAYQSLDKDGKFLEVNDKWLETLGYQRDAVLGKRFYEFLEEEEVPRFKEDFQNFVKQGEISGIYFKLLTADGRGKGMKFFGRISHDKSGEFKRSHCVMIAAESETK